MSSRTGASLEVLLRRLRRLDSLLSHHAAGSASCYMLEVQWKSSSSFGSTSSLAFTDQFDPPDIERFLDLLRLCPGGTFTDQDLRTALTLLLEEALAVDPGRDGYKKVSKVIQKPEKAPGVTLQFTFSIGICKGSRTHWLHRRIGWERADHVARMRRWIEDIRRIAATGEGDQALAEVEEICRRHLITGSFAA